MFFYYAKHIASVACYLGRFHGNSKASRYSIDRRRPVATAIAIHRDFLGRRPPAWLPRPVVVAVSLRSPCASAFFLSCGHRCRHAVSSAPPTPPSRTYYSPISCHASRTVAEIPLSSSSRPPPSSSRNQAMVVSCGACRLIAPAADWSSHLARKRWGNLLWTYSCHAARWMLCNIRPFCLFLAAWKVLVKISSEGYSSLIAWTDVAWRKLTGLSDTWSFYTVKLMLVIAQNALKWC
jgi:hypothetical protein